MLHALDQRPPHSRMTIEEHLDDIFATSKMQISNHGEGVLFLGIRLRGRLVPETIWQGWVPVRDYQDI